MRGRPGLLRTVLEAQETRGLTRSDDISRLLPSEVRIVFCDSGSSACPHVIRGPCSICLLLPYGLLCVLFGVRLGFLACWHVFCTRPGCKGSKRGCLQAALLARGRTERSAKLLFFAKLAEKALQIYERDGWGEFPTVINPDRREIRPTADRGPILLCVDTSGSMRGPREVVAKALALECMRAAREQERGCYVFAFSGPQEVGIPVSSSVHQAARKGRTKKASEEAL